MAQARETKWELWFELNSSRVLEVKIWLFPPVSQRQIPLIGISYLWHLADEELTSQAQLSQSPAEMPGIDHDDELQRRYNYLCEEKAPRHLKRDVGTTTTTLGCFLQTKKLQNASRLVKQQVVDIKECNRHLDIEGALKPKAHL